jgi:hypothetical protein
MPANSMKRKKRRRCFRRSGALRLSPAGEVSDKGVSDEDMDPFGSVPAWLAIVRRSALACR